MCDREPLGRPNGQRQRGPSGPIGLDRIGGDHGLGENPASLVPQLHRGMGFVEIDHVPVLGLVDERADAVAGQFDGEDVRRFTLSQQARPQAQLARVTCVVQQGQRRRPFGPPFALQHAITYANAAGNDQLVLVDENRLANLLFVRLSRSVE